MYCCPNCFTDNFLKAQVEKLSNKNSKCSFCKSINVPVIKPEYLSTYFEPLMDLYEINNSGQNIADLIQSDWAIFSIDRIKQIQFLTNLTKTNVFAVYLFVPIYKKEQKNIHQWELFREELKHENRFFPKNAITKVQLEPFAEFLGIQVIPGKQKFYRARITPTENPLKRKDMGKPPKNLVLNGRANPLGIPYLYLASDIDTAIAEVRAQKGETVTVAEFHIKNKLELADLRNPQKTVSPFGNSQLELFYKNMPFLNVLADELAKPVIPRITNLEYLPTQYLTELFKHIGFHGLIYRSSIAGGHNYVIFNDRKLKIVEIYHYIISDVKSCYSLKT